MATMLSPTGRLPVRWATSAALREKRLMASARMASSSARAASRKASTSILSMPSSRTVPKKLTTAPASLLLALLIIRSREISSSVISIMGS